MPRRQRARIASGLLATAAMAITAAGCSSGELDGARVESEASVPTTASDTSTTTITIDADAVLADLPSCTDLAPAVDVAWDYRTLPDWVPDELPERFELTDAVTYGPPTNSAAAPVAPTDASSWSLVQFDADRVSSSIRLTRGVADPDGYSQSGFAELTDERVLESVRGLPGRISRWINRGDPVGQQVAEWTENGDRWLATSALDVDQLGAALEPLALDGDTASDPTGRFQVLGQDRSDPTDSEFVERLTALTITERTIEGQPDLNFSVQIEQRPPTIEGLLDGRIQPGSRRTEIDGRTAMRSSPELNDARTFLTTTLADGSLLTITWYEDGATYRTLDDESIRRIDESLREVAASLRQRTAADDEQLARLLTQSDDSGGQPVLCRER